MYRTTVSNCVYIKFILLHFVESLFGISYLAARYYPFFPATENNNVGEKGIYAATQSEKWWWNERHEDTFASVCSSFKRWIH